MTHIKTSSGFEADIDEESLDDYRLLKTIRETEKSPTAIVDVLTFVLGENEDALVDHLVAATGRASLEDIEREVGEIFAQLGNAKKK